MEMIFIMSQHWGGAPEVPEEHSGGKSKAEIPGRELTNLHK